MKKKKNGFILTETLIVSSVVAFTLVILFSQFRKLNNNYNTGFTYNQTSDIYLLNSMKKFIKQDLKIYNDDTISYIDITDCSSTYFNDTNLCSTLITDLGVNKLIYSKIDLIELKEDIDTLNYDAGLVNYINKIDSAYDSGYRLIAKFNNGRYANVTFDASNSALASNEKTSTELLNILKKDTSSGLVEDAYESGRYYFKGADPKNRITLQESTGPTPYRIISFEADGTIKVVREERINTSGNIWDAKANRSTTLNSYCTDNTNYGCNAWGNMYNTYRYGVLMNTYFSLKYYANTTATSMSITGRETGTVTYVKNNSSLNEYLNGTYLTTNLAPISNYIDEHMWDVGGVWIVIKDFEKDIEESKVNQWKGYIALPSIIDYKKASDNTTQCINLYSSTGVISGTSYYPCTKNNDGNINNYFYKSDYTQWSLSAYANSRNLVWGVDNTGYFNAGNASASYGVRPSFYLKSSIKLTGNGTVGKEFTIVES